MKIFITILFFLNIYICHAQTGSSYVQFTYDARGNRTGRQIVLPSVRRGDSTLDTTAIKDNVGENAVSIYPNPIVSQITVKLHVTENQTSSGTLEVLNAIGTKMGESPITENEGTFNFENLPTGVYILRIRTNNQNLDWKVLKQ
ncbi:MAG: hypothetical protein RLZZ175_2276 [Bacteroidota bacterium]|jgi:hypothetical protein